MPQAVKLLLPPTATWRSMLSLSISPVSIARKLMSNSSFGTLIEAPPITLVSVDFSSLFLSLRASISRFSLSSSSSISKSRAQNSSPNDNSGHRTS